MSDRRLRARRLLADNLRPAVAVLVVLLLIGGWLTFGAHVAAPPMTTEERTVGGWEATGAFDHGATVRRGTPVFDAGDRLENRSAYFRRPTPVLDGRHAFRYGAANGSLSVRTELRLVVRSVETDGGESEPSTVYWATSRRLGRATAADLPPGEAVAVPFRVNVSAAVDRIGTVQEQLGASPGRPEIRIVATTRFRGDVEGRPANGTLRRSLRLVPENDAYRVVAPSAATERYERTAAVTVPERPGTLRAVGGPLLFFVAALGLAGLGAARARTRLALTGAERRYLSYRADREEYDDWIRAVDLPSDGDDRPRASAESLADLAEYAIDADTAVLADPDERVYRVFDGGYVYVYEPPELPGASDAPGRPSLTRRPDS